MGDLLALAVEAHGGMQRRDEFKTLRTELFVAGSICSVEQQSGLLTGKIFEIETNAERLTITPFTRPERRSVFVQTDSRFGCWTVELSRPVTIPRLRLPAKHSRRPGIRMGACQVVTLTDHKPTSTSPMRSAEGSSLPSSNAPGKPFLRRRRSD
jgi:hypothetical protein